MRIHALQQRKDETYDAAGKAMQDVFSVLEETGAKTIWSMPKSSSKYLKVLDLPYLIFYLLFCMGKDDILFFSIPENNIKIKLVKRMQKIKKYQILCFINDLNAFRYGGADSPEVKTKICEETVLIGVADSVLVPNENACELLRNNGVTSRLIPIGIWDYRMSEQQVAELQQQQLKENNIDETRIAFAGNLNKSGFLFHNFLTPAANIKVHLWGKISKDKEFPPFCEYHGVLSAQEMPLAVCNMDYGLVWDGTGKDEIEGGLGEYLRYNNSHKCGLYLAAGLPVIVWKDSGMAIFVRKYRCGICIRRLSELQEAICAADYTTLKRNAEKVAVDLRKGSFLKTALNSVMDAD